MTRRILEGAALAKFEDATTSPGTEMMELCIPKKSTTIGKTLHEALHANPPQLEDARVHGKSGRTQ